MVYEKETFDQMNAEINKYRLIAARMEKIKDRIQTDKNNERTQMLGQIGEMALRIADLTKAVAGYKEACTLKNVLIEEKATSLRIEKEKRGELWRQYNTLQVTLRNPSETGAQPKGTCHFMCDSCLHKDAPITMVPCFACQGSGDSFEKEEDKNHA